ncbi:hypothetical protein C1631_002405 [Chryseobacterium phosphatilyticum]|uniref:Transporter suffix domain-containing protein n=1 Tax=Chryseobacterium phosphatilyticum TaxID=475075 RepID=A0A316XKU4_9FLAO|nr:transporter suffix domain-containing protein [Chryseobacterium phosphatilyticum]PWN71500.1 hypothetical protein C1631_002405 [Chryseobacterium phosphatilyticum]
MPKEKFNLKNKPEYIFLVLGSLCLVAIPALFLLDFPNKAATILVVLILGELLFLITITLSGKGYTEKIKESFTQFFGLRQKIRNKKD